LKLNRKAFTLVELLAMLVVLGILIGITVPNITGILNQQKTNGFVEDATKMVNRTKTKMSSDSSIKKPVAGHCLVFTLNYLNDNDDIDTGPNGGSYLDYNSFVIVTRQGTEYKYYIRLVEDNGSDGYYGVSFSEYTSFKENYNTKIEAITRLVDFDDGYEKSEAAAGFNDYTGINICTSEDLIDGIYY
jgi:type II secretory pathway pseudopilin PulG